MGENTKAIECPRCDFANPAGAKFCIECGVPLGAQPAIARAGQTEEAIRRVEQEVRR